jgi:hypothetical protein
MKHKIVPSSLTNRTDSTSLKEMRLLAHVPLHEASKVARISYSHLWKAEAGYAQLKAEQEKILLEFYRSGIKKRMERVNVVLGAES